MGTLDDTELYTAVISVNERPYASAQPTRTFYQVPVSLWNRQPRALDFPAQINDPGPGADFALDYRNALGPESPVFAVVAGFIRTYLTATNGLDRYVVAGAPCARSAATKARWSPQRPPVAACPKRRRRESNCMCGPQSLPKPRSLPQ